MRALLALAAIVWAAALHAQGGPPFAADLNETVIEVPFAANGAQTGERMIVTLFKPDGEGPFPFAIINHGRAPTPEGRTQLPRQRYLQQARWLVRKGIVVLVPTRRGYGVTGGFDVEAIGNCGAPAYADAMAGGVASVLAVIDYAKAQPFVDPGRFILIGQSAGGFLTVGVAATNPAGLVAAVNFAGGHGGDPVRRPGQPCRPDRLLDVYSVAGKTARVPMLWIYTENDQFFAPEHARAWHAGFVAMGGRAELAMLPPFKSNGHVLFAEGIAVWRPLLDDFLKSAGF